MTVGDRARRSARGNRWGLALLGVLLAAAGGASLAAGLGAFGAGFAGTPLLGGAVTRWLAAPWLPYAAAAVAVLVALLALRWLLAQGRTDTVQRLRMENEATYGTIEMPSSAARGVLEEEIGEYPGVRRAHAHLTESRHDPNVRLDLTLDNDADAAAVWRRVREEGVAHLRDSLEIDRLPAVIRMSMTSPPRHPARQLG